MEKLFVNIRKAEPADIGGIASIYEQAVLLGTASFEVTPPSEAKLYSRFPENHADFNLCRAQFRSPGNQ